MFSLKPFENIKTAIYLRVSTDEQVKNGNGLDYQLEECKKLCAFKRLNVVKIYREEGVSGTTELNSRPMFNQLLKDLEAGLFKVLVTYSLDRIARKTRIILNLYHDLEKQHGFEIIFCRESIDTTTGNGQLMLTMCAGMSEYELSMIISRMKLGKELKKKKDGYVGGRLPYGYVKSDNKIIVDEYKGKVVKYIFDLSFHKNNPNQITKLLNDNNIPGPTGSKWYRKTVNLILNNKDKYEGGLINNNENNIRWPEIIFKNDLNNHQDSSKNGKHN